MESVAHVYSRFAPVGIGLLASCGVLAAGTTKSSFMKRYAAVAGLWLASSGAVLALLIMASSPRGSMEFIAQRDLGYWFGASLALALPFLANIAVAHFAPAALWNRSTRFLALTAVSALVYLAVPQLFAIGWVAGCALLGYPSCL